MTPTTGTRDALSVVMQSMHNHALPFRSLVPIPVLDDDLPRRRWLRLSLIAAHRSVVAFESPEALLSYLEHARPVPHVVVAAQSCLGDDLTGFAARLAQITDGPRLILIGDPDRPLFSIANDLGIADVLLPPLDRHDLAVAVGAALARSRHLA